MSFLPIVERELRISSRSRMSYFARTMTAAVAMVILIWVGVAFRRETDGLGMALFISLASLLFAYTLFSGCRMTADVISEEKREGTLGLLFLTHLKGFDVVLGKMASNSLRAFYGILAMIPIAAIPLLAGGVTIGEVERVAIVALNLLFFSLTAGIFASSLVRDERRAVMFTFLFIVVVCALAPALAAYTTRHSNFTERNRALEMATRFSPICNCVYAFEANYAAKKNLFLANLAITHFYGWACLIFASLYVPFSWQDKSSNNSPRSWRSLLFEFLQGSSLHRAHRRRILLDQNPILWLNFRSRLKQVSVWMTLLVILAIYLYVGYKASSPNFQFFKEFGISMFVAILTHLIIKGWVASEAASRFAQDRRSGALELILSTPLSVREILHGYYLSLLKQFAWPVLGVFCFDLVLFLLTDTTGTGNDDIVVVSLVGEVTFLVDLIALSLVSMWQSMLATNSNKAAGASVARVMLLPWIIFFALLTLTYLFDINLDQHGTIWTWIWGAISIIISYYFARQAKLKLERDFRKTATLRILKNTPIRNFLRLLFTGKRPAQTDA